MRNWNKVRAVKRKGFTLIETIVAMTIFAIAVTVIIQLFSAGLRANKASSDYTTAIIYATNKMEESLFNPVSDAGNFENGFNWEVDVSEYEIIGENKILKITVRVKWNNKSIELSSLKLDNKVET